MTQSDSQSDPDARRWVLMRWAVRFALALGIAASVSANVLHARSDPISRVIASWAPLALMLTIEIITRVPVHRRGLSAVRLAATAAIAGIAAWISYWHMVGVASRYGEQGTAPYLLPLSVDGLIVVASVCLVELSGRIRTAQGGSPTRDESAFDEVPQTRVSLVNAAGQPEPGSDSSPTGERPGDDGSRQDDGTERTPLGLLGDRERRRVLNAVRSYRRSDPGGRPSVAWVRERARLGQGRLRAADITAALAEVDAESDPQPDSEPADTTASAPINDAAVLLDVTPAN